MATNAQIARKLMETRKLMELAGETFYKYTAFERAAASIENAPPIDDLIARGELIQLPGIGKSIAASIEELAATGTSQILETLHQRYPRTIFEVLDVSGIGTKTAAVLFETYGIGSLADLERAINTGGLADAPRLGSKTIQNWKRGILAYKGRQQRTPLAYALGIAREAMAYLAEGPPLGRLTYAGSLRRCEATAGDIDLVCTAEEAARVIEHFTAWKRAEAVLAEGPTKSSIWLASGLQIDLRVLPQHLYGNLLQHFTGSREHNIKLREFAVRRNLRVSENGILNLETGDAVTCTEENDVYAALGMQYVPPELRSGLDEIELALANEIPALVELGDLCGDFNMHSTWSDGRDELELMIEAAAARGYEYHAMSDHSDGRVGMGLSVDRLREQRARIEDIGARHGIRTLCGSEVDILPGGELDYPNDVLAELDIVIASVHDHINIGREEMTRRLIRACANPHVTIIGRPTGRRIGQFDGYEFDYDEVFAAAARSGTALEINGQALRLDLPSALAKRAKAAGVTFACDSDAHRVGDLGNVELALGQARRAGLERGDVLNARPLEGVLAFARRKRESVA